MPSTHPGDFTPQAAAYARARPGYPEELLDRLLEHTGIEAGARVADVGAGTGLFSERLAGRGLRVTAVEPNDAMRAEAPQIDGVTWREGAFEATGLGSASQDWVTAAQAFHWADPGRALPELHRVLRPRGFLTVLWNERHHEASALLTWTRDAIRRLVPGFDEGYRDRDWAAVLTSTGHFAGVRPITVEHTVRMTVERYLDLWRSHNLLHAAAGPEGVGELVDALTDHLAGRGSVDVPYRCRSWTAVTSPTS